MSRSTYTLPTVRERTSPRLTLRAPALGRNVDLWLAVKDNPRDRRARIQLGLLENEGLHACPACSVALSLEGYRITRTPFSEREVLCCQACLQEYLLQETQRA